jgi:pimeloyl-ACP methyl ester carboxylesterase
MGATEKWTHRSRNQGRSSGGEAGRSNLRLPDIAKSWPPVAIESSGIRRRPERTAAWSQMGGERTSSGREFGASSAMGDKRGFRHDASALGVGLMRMLTVGLGSLVGLILVLVIWGAAWQHFAEARDRARLPPPGVLVDVGGRRLHLRCEGVGSGPTVVMITGGGIPSVASYALQDQIAVYARVCSYDRAGLGWSDPSPEPLGLAEQARDLEKLLQGGGVQGPLVLAPESFGALIALSFAERSPGRIAGIAFIDGSEPRTWFATVAREGMWRSRLRDRAMTVGWRTGVVRLLLPNLEPTWVASLPAETRAQFRAVFSRPNPGWGDALDAYQRTVAADRPSSTAGVLGSVPVLVLHHGRGSALVSEGFEAAWPEAQAILGKLSAGPSTVIEVGDASHTIAQEQPGAVAAMIKSIWFSTAK